MPFMLCAIWSPNFCLWKRGRSLLASVKLQPYENNIRGCSARCFEQSVLTLMGAEVKSWQRSTGQRACLFLRSAPPEMCSQGGSRLPSEEHMCWEKTKLPNKKLSCMVCIWACIYCQLICNMEEWEVFFHYSSETNFILPTTAQGVLQFVAIWLDWF